MTQIKGKSRSLFAVSFILCMVNSPALNLNVSPVVLSLQGTPRGLQDHYKVTMSFSRYIYVVVLTENVCSMVPAVITSGKWLKKNVENHCASL